MWILHLDWYWVASKILSDQSIKVMVIWDGTSYNLVYTTTQCHLSKDSAPPARKLHMPY